MDTRTRINREQHERVNTLTNWKSPRCEDGLRNEGRSARRQRCAKMKLPGRRNLRRGRDGSARLVIRRKFQTQNFCREKKSERNHVGLRVGHLVTGRLHRAAAIAVVGAIALFGNRSALEHAAANDALPTAMRSDRHPDECERESENLQQPLHGADRYLNKAFGTTTNCFEVAELAARKPGPAKAEPGIGFASRAGGYFLSLPASSIFLRYLAGSLLKSLRQDLQQSLMVWPS